MKSTDLEAARAHWRYRGEERPPWAETPGPDQESVWDYPRPPRVEPITARLVVYFANSVVGDTRRAFRVLETASAPTYYFPPDDVDRSGWRPTDRRTICEWKGEASYAHIYAGSQHAVEAVWWYEEPWHGFERIAGWPSFHPARVGRCEIDGVIATPQPGGLYGGWVTPELAGPIKGAPGTSSW